MVSLPICLFFNSSNKTHSTNTNTEIKNSSKMLKMQFII